MSKQRVFTAYGSMALVGFYLHHNAIKHWIEEGEPRVTLLTKLQAKLQIEVSVASLDVGPGQKRYMVCCFANWTDMYYDCQEMMEVSVPKCFMELVPKLVDVKGRIHRVFAREASLLGVEPDGWGFPALDGCTAELENPLSSSSSIQDNDPPTSESNNNMTSQTQAGNKLPPIHKLPGEIVLDISDYILQDTSSITPNSLRTRQDHAFTLSHINSNFRAIALSSPKLWTSVFIDHSRASWEMANICYNRSGERSLHVSIEFRRAPTNFQEIIGPLATVSLRIESLVLDPTLETRQLAATALHGLNMPNLKELQLRFTVYKHIWVIPQMPELPKLEKLSLEEVQTSWKAVQYPHLTAVHCYRLLMGCLSVATFGDLINYITALKHLQSLVLDGISCQDSPNVPTVLDLPSLQSLEISLTSLTAAGFVQFLSSFNSPHLKHLSLDCSLLRAWGGHIVESLQLTKRFPQVASLVLREFPDEESIHPQHSMFIARLCPNTTHLKLDSCYFLGILASKCMDQDGGQEGVLDKLSRMEVTTQDRSASHGFPYERACFTSFFKMRERHGHLPLPQLVLNFQNVSRSRGKSTCGWHMQGDDQAIRDLIGQITGMVTDLKFAIHYQGD